MRRRRVDSATAQFLATAAFLIGIVPWAAAFWMLLQHSVVWLHNGRWPDYTMGQLLGDWGIEHHPPSYRGMAIVVQAFLNLHAEYGLLIFGTVWAIPWGFVIEASEKGKYA